MRFSGIPHLPTFCYVTYVTYVTSRVSHMSRAELQNVKFFTQIKIEVRNFTPKTRKLWLIFSWQNVVILVFVLIIMFQSSCPEDGMKLQQWNIFLEFGLNLHVHVWGKNIPMKLDVFIKFHPISEEHICYSPKFYPTSSKDLHRYICHICDILQLCTATTCTVWNGTRWLLI